MTITTTINSVGAKCQQTAQALDPGLDEYIYSALFWALGILMVINGIWVEEQYDQYMALDRQAKFNSIQSPAAAALLAQRKPVRFFWLQPHITSRLRQFIAVAVCGLMLPVQLLELSWIYKAAWRLSTAAFQSTCANSPLSQHQYFLVRYSLCAPAIAIGLATGLFLWRRSVILVFSQLSYILQLGSLRPEHPLELRDTTTERDIAPRASELKA